MADYHSKIKKMDISKRNFLSKAIAAGGAGVIVSSGVARGDTNPDSSQGLPKYGGSHQCKSIWC